MKLSPLYNSILRGKWFLHMEDPDAYAAIITNLLSGDGEEDDGSILSERRPLTMMAGVSASKAEAKSKKESTEIPPDSKAVINLHGDLIKYGSFCAYGTTEIADMIHEAADTPNISGIVLDVDSGGGCVDAIAPVIDAIQYAQAKGKPVIAAADLMASAAYYIGCYCDEIVATNSVSAEFGSIGVMCSFADYSAYYEKMGIKIHTIYSSESTHKNQAYEMALKGDYAKIKSESLDPLARGFQAAVRAHRPMLDEKVEGILNGRMFYAADALKNGLIDHIGSLDYCFERIDQLRSIQAINQYIETK